MLLEKGVRVFSSFIIVLLLVFFSLFITVSSVKATDTYFSEDFNYLDTSKWIVNSSRSPDDLIDNGWLELKKEQNKFPLVCKELNLSNNVDYDIKFKFKYDNVDHWGTGIILGNLMPPYQVGPNYYPNHDAEISHFQIWQDKSSAHKLILKNHFSTDESIGDALIIPLSQGHDTSIHTITIRHEGNNYYTFFDGVKTSLENLNSPRVPDYVCFGNASNMGSRDIWTEFRIDYFKIEQINNYQKDPVVLVPGLSASWNTRAMVYGDKVDPDEWQLIPFAKPVYERLEETLELNGYEKGKDFYTWPYDWRQSIKKSSGDLAKFIESKDNLANADKIDFIGHSLGGMVSRDWAQSNPDKTDQIITVGSPHQGAVQAYQALAGGKIGEQRDLEWVGMQLLVHINRNGFKTNADVIRKIAPVLYNLTPTYDFLNVNNNSYSNDYLVGQNNDDHEDIKWPTIEFANQAKFIVGNIQNSTPERLVLGDDSLINKWLGLWPDGRPIKTIFGTGDYTVLKSSAYLSAGVPAQYNLEHKQLVTENQPLTRIIDYLGVDTPELADSNFIYSPKNMLIFYLASPATLQVKNLTTGGLKTPDEGYKNLQMIVLPYPDEKEEHEAIITGVGNGDYKLYVGQYLENDYFWQTYTGKINTGDTQKYKFNFDPNLIQQDPLVDEDGNWHLTQAKNLLSEANCYRSISYINRAKQMVRWKRWTYGIEYTKRAIDQTSHCRSRLSDDQIEAYNKTFRAMEQLSLAWQNILFHQKMTNSFRANINYRQANNILTMANEKISMLDRMNQKPSAFPLLSLKNSEEVLEEIEDRGDHIVEPKSYLAKVLAEESLHYNPNFQKPAQKPKPTRVPWPTRSSHSQSSFRKLLYRR